MLGIGGITLSSHAGALTAALAMLPLRSRPRAGFSAKLADRLDLTFGGLVGRASRHANPVLVGAVVVASMLLLPAIVIDTDYLSYFDEKDPVRAGG